MIFDIEVHSSESMTNVMFLQNLDLSVKYEPLRIGWRTRPKLQRVSFRVSAIKPMNKSHTLFHVVEAVNFKHSSL